MSNYPSSFDDDSNLYLVHDALRVLLVEDYNPGDTTITISGNVSRFPQVGIITLTEQCSDIALRAISFTYTSHDTTSFSGLSLLPGFTDSAKPKNLTDVTQNVMADHHNSLKDALIAIEDFIGIKGEISPVPLQGTMEARINFLRKLVLQPKAWFSASRRIGIIPLCLTFKDFSTRQPNVWTWNFGDGTMSVISRGNGISVGDVSKCYYTPGIFTVTETVENDFGSDSAAIPSYITARVQAPDAATIIFSPTTNQIFADGTLRARINTIISLNVSTNGVQPLDPIIKYTWDLSDDLTHDNGSSAQASYGFGGVYDVKLRVDTSLGAYRTTVFPDVIDIVEKFNLWHFIFSPNGSGVTQDLNVYEFDLIAETYKTSSYAPPISVSRNSTFLIGAPDQTRQINEFKRNNGFAPLSLVASGDRGFCTIWWAEGSDLVSTSQTVKFRELHPFDGIWIVPTLSTGTDTIQRQWNWMSLVSPSTVYFLFGMVIAGVNSPTNQTNTNLSLVSYTVANVTFTTANYLNGATELMNNVGLGDFGDFSVYRGTWQDPAGYFVRNDGMGTFFRLKSFYATEGILSSPVQFIRKLTDMPGSTKLEGQMVSMVNGVYFFNNSGEVVVYNPTTNVWTTSGPGVNSPVFTSVQDTSVSGYDNTANTLLAASDGDHNTYLSYDYSTRAFLKFNEIDSTFTTLPIRPSGEQFTMGIY